MIWETQHIDLYFRLLRIKYLHTSKSLLPNIRFSLSMLSFFLYMVVLDRKNGMVSLSLHHNSFVHRLLNRLVPPLIAFLLLSPFFFLPYINIIRYTYSYRPCFLFILCVFHIFFKFSFSFLCRFAELFYLCTRKTGTTSCTDGGGTVTLKKKEFFERFS